MDFIRVVFWFFIFLSLVGNCWVIFVITRRRQLRTTANWFILSLAAADLGVTCVYFSTYVICEVILDTCNEKVAGIFTFFFANVSAIGLIAMVAERYVAIVHSLKYVRVFTTARRTFIIIGACWGFPFLFTVLRRAMYLADGRHSVVKTCIIDVIYILLFVLSPTVLLLTAHFHILLIARKLSLQMRALMKQVRFNITANSLKIKEIRNVGIKASTVRLVSVLVAIFTTCCGIGFYVVICNTLETCHVSEYIRVINRLLLLANSTLNPLVYAFLKEDIKRESKAFLCFKRHLKKLPF